MYRINVIIVSYRQKDVIGRAIDSAICQREYGLNKIVICDDGSDDGTWDVISQYKEKYPEIIIPYRNEHNGGRSKMYENFEKAVKLRGEADLYCELAGDDALCDGWFKTVQEMIALKKIDVRNEAIAILSDWKFIYPNGREIINRTNKLAADKSYELTRLKIRGLVCDRSMLSSAKVYERYQKIILNEGLALAEWLFDFRKFQHTVKAYYCDYVGSVYYTSIGISNELGGNSDYFKDFIYSCKRRKEEYGFVQKDSLYFDYRCAKYTFLMQPSVNNYLKAVSLFFKSFDFKYSRHGLLMEVARIMVLPFQRIKN